MHFTKKDKKTNGVIWHAREDALKAALHYGLISVESPSAKAIAALGNYRKQVVNRDFAKKVSTKTANRHQQKLALVTLAQNNIEALLPLEQLINTFDGTAGLDLEKKRIIEQIQLPIQYLCVPGLIRH